MFSKRDRLFWRNKNSVRELLAKFCKQDGGNERRPSFASKEGRAGPREVGSLEVLDENTLKSHLVAENRQSAFISTDPILRDTEDHVVVLQGRDDVSIHL